MPYLNVDDGVDEHPKIEALSDAAYRLWKASLSYCSRNETDGLVPVGKALRLTASASKKVVSE